MIRHGPRRMIMDKKEIFKMLKEEIESKVDAETLKKLEKAGTKEEALSILSDASVELDEEKLSAIAGGEGLEGKMVEQGLEWHCPTACNWHYCPGACTDWI